MQFIQIKLVKLKLSCYLLRKVTSDEEAANELSCFFTLVFVKEGDTDGPEIDFIDISKPTNSMLDFTTSVDDVRKKLNQLKDDKSLGPDGIHPMVLKKTTEIVVLPLKLIFNRSMLSYKLPLAGKAPTSAQSLRKGVKVTCVFTNWYPLLQYHARLWNL